jgi:hypothetical protein
MPLDFRSSRSLGSIGHLDSVDQRERERERDKAHLERGRNNTKSWTRSYAMIARSFALPCALRWAPPKRASKLPILTEMTFSSAR